MQFFFFFFFFFGRTQRTKHESVRAPCRRESSSQTRGAIYDGIKVDIRLQNIPSAALRALHIAPICNEFTLVQDAAFYSPREERKSAARMGQKNS